MKCYFLIVSLFTLGCAHVESRQPEPPRAPAAAEVLPERTLRSVLALSTEANAALVQTVVKTRELTYEVCPVDLGSLKTNKEVVHFLNAKMADCVNVNAFLFDARQPRATDIINHLTFHKLSSVAREWVASKKVGVGFEKSALGAIAIMFAKFRSEPYSGDLNQNALQREARELYVGTLAALVQLLTLTVTPAPDLDESAPNTLERAIAEYMATPEVATSRPRVISPRGVDVFKLLVEATDRATQGASRRMKLARDREA